MKSIEAVVLEVEVPPASGTFTVGINKVGDPLTSPGAVSTWVNLTPATREIDVVRGGARSGVVATLDVGTLTAVLVDAFDPTTNATLQPSRRIRLRTIGGQALFTGRVLDLAMESSKDAAHTWTTLTAVDGIQSLEQTRAYGATSGEGYETWAARIQRLCRRANTPTNPPSEG
jgi:hypothetical protein